MYLILGYSAIFCVVMSVATVATAMFVVCQVKSVFYLKIYMLLCLLTTVIASVCRTNE